MTLKNILFTVGMIVGVSLYGQGGDDVLLKIGDENVTLSEFERIYSKNNNENSLNRQSPEEYLDLFINFKLKVLEAESLGMDTTQKFINELNTYKTQLAKPYLSDDSIRDMMVKEAYERSKYDIRANHILISLPADASPEDTLEKYNKAMEIRQRIIDGEPFEKVARATSDDGSVKRNGGDLGYFTAFRMIYPFETAAYNTPVGEVSMPIRTSFGYHILQVTDKRPARGDIKVAHIFIRLPEGSNEEEKSKAWQKVNMVYDSLEAGEDFKILAKEYSEDPNSAGNGGEMPWFGTGRMIPEFENACYSIENIGDYTKPIKTFYGWHIIKLIDRKPIGTFEEMKPDLMEQVNRGDRAEYKSELYVNKLKKEYGYKADEQTLDYFISQLDSSLFKGKWVVPETLDANMKLFTMGDRDVTLGKFAAYVEQMQARKRPKSFRTFTNDLFDDFVASEIMKYEEEMLPYKYPEFKYIVEEYHDGILLFDIMDQRVWTKAVEDTTGLEAFHAAHMNDYMWGPRADAMIVTCDSTVDPVVLRKQYKKIMKGRLDENSLNEKYCLNDSIPCIEVNSMLVEKGENEAVDKLNMTTGIGENFDKDGRTAFVIVRAIRSPEPKKLNEARGQITSDYQNYLEKQWIAELKEKYPVEVNKELLATIKY